MFDWAGKLIDRVFAHSPLYRIMAGINCILLGVLGISLTYTMSMPMSFSIAFPIISSMLLMCGLIFVGSGLIGFLRRQ